MNNLNKENFFDEVFTKFPEAAKKFHAWIDAYKVEVNWNSIFNSDSNWQDEKGKNAPAPKFHDLPFDMQKGILLRFLCECYPNSLQQYIDRDKMAEILSRSLNVIELTLTKYNN